MNTDASLDTSFNVGTGFNGGGLGDVEYQLDIQPDGKILVVGAFTKYNGISTGSAICRINTDGSLDTSFNSGIGFINGGYENAHVVKYYSYLNRIFVGGPALEYYNYGSIINHIVRLKMDGSADICT